MEVGSVVDYYTLQKELAPEPSLNVLYTFSKERSLLGLLLERHLHMILVVLIASRIDCRLGVILIGRLQTRAEGNIV